MHLTINSDYRSSGSNSDFFVNLNTLQKTSLREGVLIGIKNIEIPNTMYNIVPGQNGTMTATFSDASTKKVYLGSSTAPYKGSPSSAGLSALLLAQLNVNTSGQTFTMTLDANTAKYTITSTQAWTLTFDDLDAGRILGANTGTTSVSGLIATPFTFPNVVNLSVNKYFFLNTDITLNSGGNWDNYANGNRSTLCKIPINVGNFGNIFYEPNNVAYHACAKIGNEVRFYLTDQKNRPVDLNNVPFSFTLDIQHPEGKALT